MTPEQREFYQAGHKAGWEAAMKRTGKSGKPWTPAEVSTLLTWQGSTADLAAEIGRSPLAIRLKRHKINRGL